MEQQRAKERQENAVNFIRVKENVMGVLFVSTVLGMVGFVVGTRERLDDLDVQHRKDLAGVKDKVSNHEYRLGTVEAFKNDGPRFTLSMGQRLNTRCDLLRNDFEHWVGKIKENAKGLKEVEIECRNLVSNTWENKQHERN